MSWSTGKSHPTYQDLYNRTITLGGSDFTLLSGQTITPSKKCIKISVANTLVDLDQNAIPTGLSSKRIAIRDWLVPHAARQQDTILNFASPLFPEVSGDGSMFCIDPSLGGVIWFNPTTITDGTQANLIYFGDDGSGNMARPAGGVFVGSTNKYYVSTWISTSFDGNTYNGGLQVIDCSSKTLDSSFSYGSDGEFSRGSVFYLPDLGTQGEVWALGNTGYMRLDLATNTDVTSTSPSGFSLTGANLVTSINGYIYVFTDSSSNHVQVYDTSLSLIKTIPNLCSNTNTNGTYTCRGIYTDYNLNKIYVGELSSVCGIVVIDTNTNTISHRTSISQEGRGYGAPSLIGYHPLRNSIYIGGSIYNYSGSISGQVGRLWLFDTSTETITQTINLTVTSATSITYVPANSTVYVGSAGEVPESVPNTDQLTDGEFFKFN